MLHLVYSKTVLYIYTSTPAHTHTCVCVDAWTEYKQNILLKNLIIQDANMTDKQVL